MMMGIPDPELREVAGGGEEELVAETLILEAMRDAILEDASAHARAAVRAEAAASSGPAALLPPSAGDASRPAGGAPAARELGLPGSRTPGGAGCRCGGRTRRRGRRRRRPAWPG